jgi:hypothetical protein
MLPYPQSDEANPTLLDLQEQLRAKSVQLSELEMMIADYTHERDVLLAEIRAIKARLWDMTTQASMTVQNH